MRPTTTGNPRLRDRLCGPHHPRGAAAGRAVEHRAPRAPEVPHHGREPRPAVSSRLGGNAARPAVRQRPRGAARREAAARSPGGPRDRCVRRRRAHSAEHSRSRARERPRTIPASSPSRSRRSSSATACSIGATPWWNCSDEGHPGPELSRVVVLSIASGFGPRLRASAREARLVNFSRHHELFRVRLAGERRLACGDETR